jgi:putative polyhydroxyalkanoate system protein
MLQWKSPHPDEMFDFVFAAFSFWYKASEVRLGRTTQRRTTMADISKSRNHNLGIDKVRERVEKVAGDIAKKMGIKYAWKGNVCDLNGTGIKNGKITISDATVSIELNLGLMTKMMKPVIEKEIEAKINEIVS